MSWTDERIDSLKRLCAEGKSASRIAGELGGVTRNAVIGKLHRLGLSTAVVVTGLTARWDEARRERLKELWLADTPVKEIANLFGVSRETARTAAMEMGLARRTSEAIAFKKRIASRKVVKFIIPRCEPVDAPPLHIGLFDLTNETCKFPFGSSAPFTFCGHPIARGRYCAHHAELCFVPPPVRKREPRPREKINF